MVNEDSILPYWLWRQHQQHDDTQRNGGREFLRPRDWYQKEYGKYIVQMRALIKENKNV